MKLTATEFNAKYPIGTTVRYWPVLPAPMEFPSRETKTRSEAWTLGHGEPVVLIDGLTGGAALSHVEVLDDA